MKAEVVKINLLALEAGKKHLLERYELEIACQRAQCEHAEADGSSAIFQVAGRNFCTGCGLALGVNIEPGLGLQSGQAQ